MDVGVIGVNYKSADLSFREKLVQNLQRMQTHFLHSFSKVVVSTCNRFEIYFHSPNLTATHSYLLHDFTQEFNQNSKHKLYAYFGKDCFAHLTQVTIGLDSAVIAETEIQGQIKKAYQEAQLKKTCSKELHFLFQKSLKIAKDLRKKNLDEVMLMPNLTDIVISLQQNLLANQDKPKILFIGASEVNLNIIQKIDRSCYQIYLASRSLSYAQDLSERFKIAVYPWEKMDQWQDFHSIVLATDYQGFLIQQQVVESPKLVLDLGVPRNVDPKLSQNSNVTLYHIDQLNKMVRKHRKIKDLRYNQLQKLIDESVAKQIEIFSKRSEWTQSFASVI